VHQLIHQVHLRQRGALGQPHRAWEGFHPDPNPVSLTPAKSKKLEDARLWVRREVSYPSRRNLKSRFLNCAYVLYCTGARSMLRVAPTSKVTLISVFSVYDFSLESTLQPL
jgi:hypothetical protein